MSSVDDVTWLDDDTLVVAARDMAAVYDGRTGELRGSAPGHLAGFVATDRGPALATVDDEDPASGARVQLHPISAPAETIVTVTLQPSEWATPVSSVFNMGNGVFGVDRSDGDIEVFDTHGRPVAVPTKPVDRGGNSLDDNARLLSAEGEAVTPSLAFLELTESESRPYITHVSRRDDGRHLFDLEGACGALGFRMGNDLRQSEVVLSGPTFEAQRRADLLAAFFADE